MRPELGLAGGLALLLASGAAAQPAPAGEGLQPAFLELRVNSVPGETSLVHLAEGEAWVPVADLERAGLSGFAGARRDLGGRESVALGSLAPDLSFALDERELVLRVTAGPVLLRRRTLDLSATVRPRGIEAATAPSAFLDYAVRATTEEDLSGALEAGVSAGTALLAGSASATRADGALRGLTALSVDDPRRLLRFVAGDAVARPDALGGAPVVGGLTLRRELSLDPYLVRAPLPRATAFAGTPSVLEVWVNGVLTRSQAVAPGSYDLSHLPVSAGTNDVRVVVKDAFGRTETVETAHYQGQGLLARGLHDWAWHAGAVRRRFGVESFDYGDPVLLGQHRLGITDRLTAGARADLGTRVRQGSLSATAAVPFLGELELAAAASDDEGERGGAGVLAWRLGSRRLAVGADATLRSRRYATSTLRAADDRTLRRAGLFASFPVHRSLSVTLQGTASRTRDGGTVRRIEGRTSFQLVPRLWLVVSSSATEDVLGTRLAAFAQLVVAAGGGTADFGLRAENGDRGGQLGAQRSLPPGVGVGWRVRGDTGGEGSMSALLQAQARFGRYEAGWDRALGEDVGHASAAGGLVLVREGLFVTRPVEQSFALVQVPGVAGVRVHLEHQPVGRTDAKGQLLVPGLLPYYGNRLSIVDADVPVAYRVGRTEKIVAAPPRGAALVRFDVDHLRAISGWVRLSGARGVRVPGFGTLEVDTPRGVRSSPLAEDGGFWLEDVSPGTHAARIYFGDAACEFGLSVPESGPGVVEVGTLGCEERPEERRKL